MPIDTYAEGYRAAHASSAKKTADDLRNTIAHWRHGTAFGRDTANRARGIVDASVVALIRRGETVPEHDMA